MQSAARLGGMAEKSEWLQRIENSARRLAWRLSAQWQFVAYLAALFLFLVLLGSLPILAALLGFGAGVLILMAGEAPEDDERATRGTASMGSTLGGSGGGGNAGQPGSWRAITDALPDAAVVLDGAGNVLHHNALVREFFPRIRAGQALSLATRNPELNGAIEAAYGNREQTKVQILERVPVERRIEATLSPLEVARAARGAPRLLVTFRDLSAEDRLAQMRADFIANASHELRTPLASLRGFVETLQGPAKDDPQAREKFLGIMASQAARMTRLIDDLLSLSRVEMRVHLPPRGVVDLNEVAGYVAQSLEPVAGAAKIKIALHRLEGSARIRGDREEIVQLVQNLVQNAIKYGHEGGHVEVRLSRVLDGQPPASRLLLAVSDDGPGIAAEHLPRLTERFYRANAEASRNKGGTGLGLAIVKHIALRHGADLRIASELGKGSTFSVLFEEASGRTGT